ncbi:MAG: CPBP family intramembrane metalloprotease [Rhodobacteraceae bacterium]|nr:CPBP family intramembrane metalloprotease [Paracoccaceae bacterium]
MLPAKTAKFNTYTACATAYCEPWRTALGVLLIAGLYLGAAAALGAGALKIAEQVQLGSGYALAFELVTMSSKRAVLVALFSIVLALPALWLVLKYLHRRSLKSLIAPTGRVHWASYRRAMVFIAVFGLASSLPIMISGAASQQLALSDWLPWLLPALVLIFLQTATEELFFRGYLMQQLAARFRSRWIWWVLPAVLFGVMHYSPAIYGNNTWLVVGIATLAGLIFGDITARSGDLSMALGLHFANNILALLIIGVPGQLSSLSLFLRDINVRDEAVMRSELLGTSAIMLVIYFIYLLVVRARR